MPLPYILARRPVRFSRPASLVLLMLNLVMGALVLTQGGLSVMEGDVRHIMLGVMCLFFGLFICIVEFLHIAALRMYASFLFSYCGRGLFYLIIGCLTIDGESAELGIGLVLVITGVILLGLALSVGLMFDDPEDHYANVIRNMQNGMYPNPKQMGIASAPKTILTMDSYAPQGISNSTFDVGSFTPQAQGHRFADKPPRI
ncbi:hypothetical protein IW139_006082 [Coemansia sp. RSA 353]|nr:hypothetical protein LPJ62_002830 [Coemansia sp. RSA 2167]KAJ2119034.1 hypothetical protein GGH17_005660 [Coemansia sp. RSA 788]KAJ2132765.1 hypothetical protein GGF48_000707 [Coemansia sp. RSA 921]KAJ2152207.1 hypothetical protein J3F82_002832 [Coemansia sp. RSA 637]KAJ2152240.1 hypothetical protein GGH15_006155 [Coemansia sp. RSA 562]KAJ2160353.1 hypothetical protein GGH16_005205 [Coemansia sp. RSA 560]KAJ2184974.1 hypothetical protein EV181_004099 [Coemansia sp. RSA 532]KAJ2186246.1 hy